MFPAVRPRFKWAAPIPLCRHTVEPARKWGQAGGITATEQSALYQVGIQCLGSVNLQMEYTKVLLLSGHYFCFVSLCFSQLRDAFIQQVTQGYSHYDRQLRNDLLVISSLVAAECPQAPFIETGFIKQLTLFATFQEGNVIAGDILVLWWCHF